MTNIHWLNPVSANFNTAADWSTGSVPTSTDDAILDAPGTTPYTVTASTSETIGEIQLASTATLAIASGTFFVLSSFITNAGTIAVGSAGTTATLNLDKYFVNPTLTGSGTISLGDNAGNTILVDSSHVSLTNVDNTIVGSGSVTGGSRVTLINEAAGVIDADNKTPLTIKVALVNNAGVIETTGRGHCLIAHALDNAGTLEANGGVLIVRNAVQGSGSAAISAGTIDFLGSFSQNVSFTGRRGKLQLGVSENYTASITGFSKTGGTSLDLRDIAFVSSTEATFSGRATSGVLTVTDGTHTAHITLIGDYTASTFVASSDGKGGTIVVDPTSGHAASAHRFVAAAAGLGGSAGASIHAIDAGAIHAPLLARPHAMVA
jgi:hypothetical protein